MKKSKKQESFLLKTYKECWFYSKEIKSYVLLSFLIFFLFSIIGFIYPKFFINEIEELIKKLVLLAQNLGGISLILFILSNNLWSCLISLIFGIFLAIIPVFSLIINGYILGYVCKLSVIEEGFFSLWALFPHGIFEIPAIMLSLGAGIKLGFFLFSLNPKKELSRVFVKNMKLFLFVILPLLIIAAIIEGTLMIFLGR